MQDDSRAVSYRWSIIELLSNSGKSGTIIVAFTCTGASKLFRPSCLRGSLAVLHTKHFFFFVRLLIIRRQLRKRNPLHRGLEQNKSLLRVFSKFLLHYQGFQTVYKQLQSKLTLCMGHHSHVCSISPQGCEQLFAGKRFEKHALLEFSSSV